MSYTALYRRFRPQLFADLVGQEHISRTLAAAIRQGSFVHAYLFCGPRGTGKTSTARIMARAVNCLSPTSSGEPCGECAACLRNSRGEAIDILEIDAASNRGIDEIRDLRERVKYAPALEKYKVYIIDEVHMLTAPAFNALLKTLEEPPPQVIFILATTEPHKMPLTVLSRCQRFDFRRIADSEVEAHLAQVAAAEGYTAEPAALALIARKAEGGMRDALGLLDQCAGFNAGQVTVEALNKLTGTADAAFIEDMTKYMLAADAAALLRMVARLHESGHDLRQFLRDLLEYQRDLLLLKLSTKLAPDQQQLPEWARAVDENRLLKLMQSLADGDGRLRNSLQPRLTLELALLNACGLGEEVKEPSQPATPAAPPKGEPKKTAREDNQASPSGRGAARGATERAVGVATPPLPVATPDDDMEMERLRGQWPQIVAEFSRANPSIGTFLEKADLLSLKQQRLTLSFAATHRLFMEKLTRPGATREVLEQIIAATFGRKLSIEGLLAQEQNAPPPPEDAPPEKEQGILF